MSASIAGLAPKAFNDQKRRFIPHLDTNSGDEGDTKKLCGPPSSDQEETCELKTVSEVLTHLKKEVPNVIIFSYQLLDWLKRATSLPSSTSDNSIELLKDNTVQSTTKLRQGSSDDVVPDKGAIIELLIPSVFRAILSVSPASSLDPDAVSFFSADEVSVLRQPCFLCWYCRISFRFCLHFSTALSENQRLAE
ncbi:hypothetical protein RND71_038391 [Anisodus tanguticus]|uniref:Uncharacterized protein n=1 Tax=Anisodus tanguticus TaxID=243964 RepID=A0AAE1QZJ9_9SOLA|nr:hypothetical protein RND71_038391 [Anisodus tanguticus]